MKIFLTLLLAVAFAFDCTAAPDPRATEIDWTSRNIEIVNATGDMVRIVLHTGGMAGRRLIQTRVEAFADDSYATLTYQIVQNFAESYRTVENFDVTWTIPKAEFEGLRSKRKFYLLRRDDAILKADEVKEIKANWQVKE